MSVMGSITAGVLLFWLLILLGFQMHRSVICSYTLQMP